MRTGNGRLGKYFQRQQHWKYWIFCCECSDENILSTAEHIIRDCPKYGEVRRNLADKVSAMELKNILGTKKELDELTTFLEH